MRGFYDSKDKNMIAERKDFEKYIEEFKRKTEKARVAYQETGSSSYEKTWRAENIRDYAEKFQDKNYTKKCEKQS